jgi:DNA mismatch repair ATPase MutS
VIKALAGKRDAGIISTHDLELTAMEKEIKKLRNYHFRDSVSNGKMTFDYKLLNGPCPTTNALKIMQAEGLPVE